MKFRISLLLVLALAAPAFLPCCFAQSDAALLHRVKAIYVGTMGQGNEAEDYRAMLKDELRRVGFDVADRTEDADAVHHRRIPGRRVRLARVIFTREFLWLTKSLKAAKMPVGRKSKIIMSSANAMASR